MKQTNLQIPKSILMIFIVLVSLYSTFQVCITKFPHDFDFNNKINMFALYEKRFEAIKAVLPSHGIIGYITDTTASDKTNSNSIYRQFHKYHLAQFTLSPRVVIIHDPDVKNSSRYEFVVGDFQNGIPKPDFFARNKLLYVRDFGDGIVLLRQGEIK